MTTLRPRLGYSLAGGASLTVLTLVVVNTAQFQDRFMVPEPPVTVTNGQTAILEEWKSVIERLEAPKYGEADADVAAPPISPPEAEARVRMLVKREGLMDQAADGRQYEVAAQEPVSQQQPGMDRLLPRPGPRPLHRH